MVKHGKSRKETPWDKMEELTPTQDFLRKHYIIRYDQRHPQLKDMEEADMVNSYVPAKCPHCGSDSFIKYGHDKYVQMSITFLPRKVRCFCSVW